MNSHTAIIGLLFVGVITPGVFGQTPKTLANPQAGEPHAPSTNTAPDSSGPLKIDPAKIAAIRQLLEVGGVNATMRQLMDTLKHRLKPGLENALPPGEYRDKLIGLFVERMMTRADTGKLADAAVQIYDKFLSEEDIKAFVQFYSTPLGQKSLNVLPKIVDEISAEARQWGENLGRQCMLEVLTEHPELAKALGNL